MIRRSLQVLSLTYLLCSFPYVGLIGSGLIKRNFKHLTIPTFILLYNSMVRSHLDYCSSTVWAPYRKGDREILEKVQKGKQRYR